MFSLKLLSRKGTFETVHCLDLFWFARLDVGQCRLLFVEVFLAHLGPLGRLARLVRLARLAHLGGLARLVRLARLVPSARLVRMAPQGVLIACSDNTHACLPQSVLPPS